MKTSALFAIVIAVMTLSASASYADSNGQIQIRPYVNSGGASMFVVWDTSSGTSKIFYWDSAVSKYVPTEIGLPANPLKKVSGSVMIEPYINKHGASMFVVWDTKTGDSKIFYWDSDASKYTATEVGLPRSPLK